MTYKYEKLWLFCFLYGVLGHTDQFFVKLFDLKNNVGHKEWGLDFRVKVKKGEGGSQWLREEGKDWNSIEINHTRFSRTMNIVTKDLNSERFLVWIIW